MAIVFEATAVATFYNLSGGNFQRIFDLSSGPGTDSIWLGNVWNTSTLAFEVEQDGVRYRLSVPGAITEGATTEWRVTIDDTGTFTIYEDGAQIATQNLGIEAIPNEVPRTESLIGDSPHAGDDPLIGTVESLDVETTLSDGFDMIFDDTVNVTEVFAGTDQGETLDASGKTAAITIDGGGGADVISGGQGNDTLIGNMGADTIDGGAGADSILAGAGNDSVSGGTGADSIQGNGGNDTLSGGDDNDLIYGDSAPGTYVVQGFEYNKNFTTPDTDQLGAFTSLEIDITGDPIEITFLDDDWILNNDPNSEDFASNDATQSVLVNGVEHAANIEATVTFSGDDGNSYELAVIQVDLNDDGTANASTSEQGYFLVPIGSAPPAGVNLTIAGGDYSSDKTFAELFGSQADGDDVLDGGAGDDTLVGGGGNDTLEGGDGTDVIHAGVGDDSAVGGVGNDILFGDDGADTLTGGSGNDTIYGGGNPDASVGGTTTVGSSYSVIFLGNHAEIDTVEGNYTNENTAGLIGTYGGAGDELYTKIQHAVVTPNENGTIDFDHVASPKPMVIDGVSKIVDTAFIYNATVNFTDGTNGSFSAVMIQTTDGDMYLMPEFLNNADNALLASKPIESISLDSIRNNFTSVNANRVDVDYALGDDTDTSDDVIDGGAGDDYLDGGAGNDRLDAGSGSDTVIGGTGSDTILLNDGFLGADITGGEDIGDGDIDVLDASGVTTAGVNVVLSGSEAGQITTGGHTGNFVEIESFTLTDQGDNFNGFFSGADMTVDGGGGDDTIRGGNADNTLSGGTGDDLFEVGNGIDSIDGGDGTDTLSIDAADDVITLAFDGTGSGSFSDDDGDSGTFSSIEAVRGSAGGDSIDASLDSGGVNLQGEAGNDTLLGGSGSDTIDGGTGTDVLTGGAGPDVFVVDGSADTITDFDATTGVDGGGSADNDFVDLSGYYDAASLAAFNAANGTNYRNALQWMKADQADDGILQGAGGLRIENGGAAVDATDMTVENTGVVCFVQGTLIATNRGQVPVEELCEGDLVQTMDNGLQPVRWIGKRVIGEKELIRRPELRPIRVNKRAFGIRESGQDLIVSPQHRLLLVSKVADRMFGTKEVLISAKKLLNIPGTAEIEDVTDLCYFHILLDQHEIIFANAVPAESLYLGKEALTSLSPKGRSEIQMLFPALVQKGFAAGQCRPFAEGKRAKRLAFRLSKNERQLVE